MQIRQLTAYVVRLPLKRAFAHASAIRRESENVLVACELADGTQGWGEGVPRSYVTGETPAGCLEQLLETPLGEQLAGDCGSWPDVIGLCQQFQPVVAGDDPRGCYGNALRCAVELSILDAFGQLLGEPISVVTEHFEPAAPVAAHLPTVRYGAVIGSGSRRLRFKALIRRLYGFQQCKVKVGKAGDDDRARLDMIRRWIGPDVDLRIDANEAWDASELGEKLRPLVPLGVSCVEQPVPHAEVDSLAPWREKLTVPIMLDESLTSLADARAAIAGKTCDLFNIRLSKCGGFLASLRLAAAAHEAGLGYQLGCHPGESGILSAAGRHWATSVAGIRYWEGSYDRHLLAQRITNEDMTFGYGGQAPALAGPGLGITIDPSALQDVTVIQQLCPIT